MGETGGHPRTKRSRGVLARWLVAGLALAALAGMAGTVRINFEGGSAPPGLYSLRSGSLERGAWVAVCLPQALARWGRSRGYLDAGRCPGGAREVGKKVVAVPGDIVVVGAEALWVNGHRVAGKREARDSAGRHLPRVPEGRYRVPAGHAWLVSTHHERSWDSRYFGPVPLEPDRARLLVPLWSSGKSSPGLQTPGPGGPS